MSLLLLTVNLRGVSNKHCLLSLFSFFVKLDIETVINSNGFPQHMIFWRSIESYPKIIKFLPSE